MKKKISILTPTISENAMGRAYLIAKLLQPKYSVTIVGNGSIENIWRPVKNDKTINYKLFKCDSVVDLFLKANDIIDKCMIDSDLIYSIKPLLSSYGLGLIAKRKLKVPLILDVDDWEIGFLLKKWHWELQNGLKYYVNNLSSPFYTRILDKLCWCADFVTVSNSFLQEKYGGVWIPHARNEKHISIDQFDCFNKSLDQMKVVFLGTPRLHKGLDVLIAAWSKVNSANAKLYIIGVSPESDLYEYISRRGNSSIEVCGTVSMNEIPAILSSASIIVIPQKLEKASVGQLPAKLIDAMAAGRAIISTEVNDIPMWLSCDAGIVVPPDDSDSLARAINDLLEDQDKRQLLGRNARYKFIKYGSFAATVPRIENLVSALILKKSYAPCSIDAVPNDLTRKN
ncbi:MAG: glycosyltransferase family 4 protein [Desulfobacterium sp.]|nr:glycosyltransferase family 4 protein [Desulfobacterium sp.]